MREMLEPLFGELGALVAQFATTVVVVLALIAVVYWLVRRLSGLRLGGIGRGRVPRLAIVDAMAIDSRRRLVLIRRDNVEHLIMIGGPSDLVVEPSIVRLRQRGAQRPARAQQQQPAAGAPPPPPAQSTPAQSTKEPEPPTANAPIPFPPQRAPHQGPAEAAAEPSFQPAPGAAKGASPSDSVAEEALHRAPVAGVAPPARTASTAPAVAGGGQSAGDGEALQPFLPRMARLDTDRAEVPAPRHQEPIAAGDESDDPDQHALNLDGAAPPVAANDAAAAPPTQAEVTAAKVSDLEEEMARLLGEITVKRRSS